MVSEDRAFRELKNAVDAVYALVLFVSSEVPLVLVKEKIVDVKDAARFPGLVLPALCRTEYRLGPREG